MMDEKNKKLEEFFNRSLEEFKDGPSGQVWDGLAERLEDDMTFMQRWRNQILQWLPLLLLLLGFGTYFLFTQNKINLLEEELMAAHENNLSLDLNLKMCVANNEKLNNTNSAILSETTVDSKNDKAPPSLFSNSTATKNNQHTSGLISSTNKDYIPAILPAVSHQILKEEKKQIPETVESVNPSSTERKKMLPLEKLSRHQSRIAPYYINSRSNLGLGFVYITPVNKNQQLEEMGRYRVGYIARSVSTIMSGIGNSFNLGHASGLRQEFQISKNWALTNQVSFVHQHYQVSNNDKLIPYSTLRKFPGAENLNDIIKNIEVESSYLDFSLGIKWIGWRGKNGSTYFVNPSVVWQVYLPQEYKYGLTAGNTIDRREERYFGYFGSGNLQVGMERRWKERWVWQLGIWAERSFIPLGLEDQEITMAGLSTSILFGK